MREVITIDMNKHLKYCLESLRFTLTYGLSFLFFKNLISWWYTGTYWLPEWLIKMTLCDALGFIAIVIPILFIGSLIQERVECGKKFQSKLDASKDI